MLLGFSGVSLAASFYRPQDGCQDQDVALKSMEWEIGCPVLPTALCSGYDFP